MPCRSDYMKPTPAEREALLRKELDRLTRDNDHLRELVVFMEGGGKISDVDLTWVTEDQVKHREEDLARLDRTLRDIIATNRDGWVDMPSGRRMENSRAYEWLGRVAAADPCKPLQAQLGFDPDSI